ISTTPPPKTTAELQRELLEAQIAAANAVARTAGHHHSWQ
ncbi:MAG: hypothetical protein JWN41_976, partial [Thermoleophilia bacterium]|nr:hypothetical protein [Thermoleophilia bacterium]